MTDVNVNDVGELVGAITTLNGSSGPHSITLLGDDNDYIVAEPSGEMFGDLAFPAILQDITIYGQGRTITRALDAPKFRFFAVDAKYESTEGKLTLENLKLFNGDSDTNGGGAIINDGETIIRDCHFSGNVAGTYGGVIYAGDGKPLVIENTTFSNNIAIGTDARGGAIYGSGNCDLTIIDCVFFRNRVKGSGSQGSAIYIHVGALAAMSGSDISCNVVEESTNDEAVYNASSLQFNAENNWWGADDGPNGGGVSGSGQSIGGNVDASPFNDTPSSLDVVIWYNRKAAGEYAIDLSRNNFNYGSSPFPYGTGNLNAPTSVGGDFTYNFLSHESGATGSAIFMSESIYRGHLPMTLGDGGINECSQDDDDAEATGWRVCCGDGSGATKSWRVHPNVIRYFLGIILPDTPDPSNTLEFNDLLAYMKFDQGADGGGQWRSGHEVDGPAYLYELFDTGDLAHIDTGDYVFIDQGTNDRHGFLIVGWGKALSSFDALDATEVEDVEFHVARKRDGEEIPYVADFCYGYDSSADYTGWLQDPRPRPFYTSAADISDSQLTNRFGFTSTSELDDYKEQFQAMAWRRFTFGATSGPCAPPAVCFPNWRFFHLPSMVDVASDRTYCPDCSGT